SIYARLDAVHFFKTILSTERVLSENEYKRLLLQLEDEYLEVFRQRFNDLPACIQYAFIDVLGVKRNSINLSFLESQLEQDDDEIRVRTLKAINEIGVIRDVERYFSFIES